MNSSLIFLFASILPLQMEDAMEMDVKGEIAVKISVIEDANNNWTIDSVLTSTSQVQFGNSTLTNSYFGYTTTSHWFRIELPNDLNSPEIMVVVNFPGIYDVTLFDGLNETRKVYRAGTKYPGHTWPIKSRKAVFKAKHFQDDHVLYLRAVDQASLIVPIEVMEVD